ncbi:glycosyltransferase family 4 protein [Candidatus Pacearchaeota archaeon]|nr:glycosyltransferase family 4 protein [Candidatus Pacearchaeota archaeon]
MKKNKLNVGIILASDPNFLGGLALYQKNLISCLSKDVNLSLIYKGSENKKKIDKEVNFFQIKAPDISFIGNFIFEFKVRNFLKRNKFNLLNSHGFTGLWMESSKKNTKLIHTYHGSTYHFYKNHLKRFNKLKRILFYPILIIPYFIERFPMKKANQVICVSEHVKNDLINLHGTRKNIDVIRTGVDLKDFKLRDKKKVRKKLILDEKKIYGLYVGRGGFWTKGLDKVINLSKEIYKLDNNFRLIIIGAEKNKVKHLLNNRFTIFLPPQQRKDILYYYNASNIFFSMSRCEGGAPTMVTSEAMASGCLIVTDKEANQEIFKDKINGLILSGDYVKEGKRILKAIKNKKEMKKIINNSLKTIKNLSLEKWGKKYLNLLIN